MNFFYPGKFEDERALELRQQLEGPNRKTVSGIFAERERERKQKAYDEYWYQQHLRGVHRWGSCPWCPWNYFYD